MTTFAPRARVATQLCLVLVCTCVSVAMLLVHLSPGTEALASGETVLALLVALRPLEPGVTVCLGGLIALDAVATSGIGPSDRVAISAATCVALYAIHSLAELISFVPAGSLVDREVVRRVAARTGSSAAIAALAALLIGEIAVSGPTASWLEAFAVVAGAVLVLGLAVPLRRSTASPGSRD